MILFFIRLVTESKVGIIKKEGETRCSIKLRILFFKDYLF